MSWLSSFGRMEVEERQWRKGPRRVRPFITRTRIKPRGLSRRMQRLVTDMGADNGFGRAAEKMKEHHGVEVPVETLRQCVLRHAMAMAREADKAPACTKLKAQGPEWIVAAADGTMVPIVRTGEAPEGADKRKHRKLAWEEMRLVAAQAHGQSRACYDATLGSVEDAGRRWSRVAGMAGWALNTRIHALGDGAEWIARQAKEAFGACHRYTVDLYHVCEYLSRAAPEPGKSRAYVARHREALKQNQTDKVLASLRKREEEAEWPESEAPVRAALRYLENRREQLDYAHALNNNLPVGSGMIESGHRHVLQARLKRSGAWWTPDNVHAMAQLRVCRANGLWHSYWSN